MSNYKIPIVIILLLLGLYSCKESNNSSTTTNNTESTTKPTNKDLELQIDGILSKMSLKEKVGQTCQITLDVILKRDETGAVIEPIEIDTAKLQEAMLDYGVGSVLNVGSHTLTLEQWKHVIDHVYRPFSEGKTKAPIIYGIDAIHGVNYTVGGTLFPQEIGLAASWNPDLAKKFGEVVAYETRASGIHWNFSPVLDLGRQPLWSRHFETLGEDPVLATKMGSAIVAGYQGEDDNIDSYHVAACLKHFVGYSGSQSGRDRTPGWIPKRFMKELFLPAFKDAIDKGALTVMVNSGDVNGVPGHINYELLTKTLKEEWGFQGFAVSDWEDFIFLHTVHQVATDIDDAIVQGFNAGVDMSMVPLSPQYQEYCKSMLKSVEAGKITKERLDDAVRRILRVKILAGLFEENRRQATDYSKFASDAHKKLALDAALESITLLKNEDSFLPLSKDKKVLIAGPTANNLIFLNGAWSHTWQGADTSYNTKGCKTIREAFRSQVGSENCLFAQGAELFIEAGFEQSRLVDEADFMAKANQSDVIVLCLGEYPSTEKPGDIHSLNLDPAQLELAKMAYSTNKKVLLIMVEGRPRIIRDIVDEASGIIQAYLPGDYGADALVKLIYGEENFSGKLPYTYPKFDGVIEFYDHPKSVARAKSNGFVAYNPQWDFGYGLSYSNIEYSNLTLSDSTMTEKGSIKVAVTVSNKSDRAVKEVVQFYISDQVASLVPAGKRLKYFSKIALGPNESKKVDFSISVENLMFVDNGGNWIFEKGDFKLSVANLIRDFELK